MHFVSELVSTFIGNQQLSRDWAHNGKGYFAKKMDISMNTDVSVALGFRPTTEYISEEYVAVCNVCSKYLGGLLTGTTDPVTEIPKFLEELDRAGLTEILKDAQKQFDEWYQMSN